ncbi:MAG: peptidyl-prolyl cis-trans isomerase [Desulfomonile tiedjei]|uniref:peptidylprolyl isomerase n=1 Tax=Desulfomonile tiedjei TaxID=2358 RepID=A0A9D6V194_9BACT|nr:peptidyl-prolyl cis-trans isomerase [Desulfomonile tiedjei]
MRRIGLLLVVLALASAPAFAQETQATDVLATVGNHKITREMLDHIISTIPEENRVPFLTPDGRKKILDEVVAFMLLAEAAKTEGLDKDPAIKARLEYAQTEYLAREHFRRHLAKSPQMTEQELEAYYKEHISEFKPPEEIQARHILVKTESEANKVLEQAKSGKDFSELAKKYSIDPAGQRGGKLELQDGRDWLPRGTFEKSFEHVLFKLPKGEVGGPVKTQFGWHILKADDRRAPETVSFVQVRAMIKNRLQDQKNAQLHNQLTEQAKKTIPVTIK